MLASSPTMRISGSEYTTGTSTRMRSAIPGPTDATSVSVVKAPPDVLKYRMKTSDSVVIDRTSVMPAKLTRTRTRGNAYIFRDLSPNAHHDDAPRDAAETRGIGSPPRLPSRAAARAGSSRRLGHPVSRVGVGRLVGAVHLRPHAGGRALGAHERRAARAR